MYVYIYGLRVSFNNTHYQFNVYIMYVHTNAHGCSATFIPAVICQLSQATLHMVTISTPPDHWNIPAYRERVIFQCPLG